MSRWQARGLLFATYLMLPSVSYSAAPPIPPQLDSGAAESRRQQLENYYREDLRLEQEDKEPVITAPEEPVPVTDQEVVSARFVLKKINFSASHFLTGEELQEIAAPYIGQQVSMKDLGEIISRINHLYKSRKIITALAVLPPQKITAGEVNISLVEGKLGEARVQSKFTRPDYLLSSMSLHPGDVVNTQQLERDLIWFNRTHDIQVKAAVRPGSEPGRSDFDIEVQEPQRLVARLFADNQNTPSFGREQVGIDARLNGILGVGDFVSMYLSRSEGATNGYVAVGLPFNYHGGQITASYSKNDTSVIYGPYEQLEITGVSYRGSLSISQPFYVDRQWMLSGSFTYANTDSKDYIADVLLSKYEIDSYALSLLIDRRGTGYQWYVQPELTYGRSTDQFDQHTDYHLGAITAGGIWALSDSLYLLLRAGGQHTNSDRIPPAALYQIGGTGSVRGYDPGIASGFDGLYANVELHAMTPWQLEPFLFVDHGRVFSPDIPKTEISGIGAGLSWDNGPWSMKLLYGKPLDEIRPDQRDEHLNFRLELTY